MNENVKKPLLKRWYFWVLAILLFLLILIIVIAIATGGGDSDKQSEIPQYTEAKLSDGSLLLTYKECPSYVAYAVYKALKEFEPTAEPKVKSNEWRCYYYENPGVFSVYFYPAEVYSEQWGKVCEWGVDCWLSFADESHEKFSVHYLEVGGTEYVHDAVYDSID